MKNFFRKVAFGLKPEEKAPIRSISLGNFANYKMKYQIFLLREKFILKKNYGNITENGYLTIEKNLEKNLRKIKKDTNLLKIN